MDVLKLSKILSVIDRESVNGWRVIAKGLTDCFTGAMLSSTGNRPVGFSSSFSKGVQSPLKTVVFLCQKISASLKTPESFHYGVVILGELNGSPHLCAALLTLLNHATQCLAALGGVYSLLSKGLSA